MKPGGSQGHDEVKNDVLERISKEYGKPEEKQREAVKKLGKDEFFKIMVTQIQHQDPMKPYENEQMAAQMAQFSALEQMMNVNQNLEKLAQAQQPLHHLGAAGLIGKYVTADSGRIIHTEGKYSNISFELPADADNVRLILINERGENVREIEKHGLKKGPVKVEWDGKNSGNFPAKSGNYMVQISASTSQGKNIPVQTQHTSVVHGVAQEGNETVLLTGDITKPQKLLLKNVFKIVDATQAKELAAKPQIAGLPAGMEFTGLENLVKQAAEGGAPGGDANEAAAAAAAAQGLSQEEIEQLINSQERPMENYDPGAAPKYDGGAVEAMRRANMPQAPIVQPPSADEIRKMLEQAPDLSGANPAAEAVRAGRSPVPSAPAANKEAIDSINPAAKQFGNFAAGQSVPSSGDGSVAGQLAK